jgi:hypothetical protein
MLHHLKGIVVEADAVIALWLTPMEKKKKTMNDI